MADFLEAAKSVNTFFIDLSTGKEIYLEMSCAKEDGTTGKIKIWDVAMKTIMQERENTRTEKINIDQSDFQETWRDWTV